LLPVYLNMHRIFDIDGKLEYTWIAYYFISCVSDISKMEKYTTTTSAGPYVWTQNNSCISGEIIVLATGKLEQADSCYQSKPYQS
jgi:hypothetical protein